MKTLAFLTLALCVTAAQADWVDELRGTLANYALRPVHCRALRLHVHIV